MPVKRDTSKIINVPATVSLKRVPDYDAARVLEAMRACLALLGGMKAFVRPGQRVLLKPNLLGAFPAERAITTHPAVVRAAILLVQEAGGQTMLGDSPGMSDLADTVRVCGLEAILRETGTTLVDFSEAHEFDVPGFVVGRKLKLAKALLDADVVISLPKLKTHAQMTHTGALKNQFGCVPGTLKGQWHFRMQEPAWLASLILDVNRVVRPALAIMDAIMAMEGDGPAAGKPRFVGAMLAGGDAAAVDTISCQLINLDPSRVPLLAAAREQRFGQTEFEHIQILGEDWQQLRVPDFQQVASLQSPMRLVPLPRWGLRWIRRQWTLRPRILREACTQCGVCEKGCPVTPAAIHPKAKGQQLEDARCIRCYCCHEFCPAHAITLQKPWLIQHIPLDSMAEQARRLVSLLAKLRNRRR